MPYFKGIKKPSSFKGINFYVSSAPDSIEYAVEENEFIGVANNPESFLSGKKATKFEVTAFLAGKYAHQKADLLRHFVERAEPGLLFLPHLTYPIKAVCSSIAIEEPMRSIGQIQLKMSFIKYLEKSEGFLGKVTDQIADSFKTLEKIDSEITSLVSKFAEVVDITKIPSYVLGGLENNLKMLEAVVFSDFGISAAVDHLRFPDLFAKNLVDDFSLKSPEKLLKIVTSQESCNQESKRESQHTAQVSHISASVKEFVKVAALLILAKKIIASKSQKLESSKKIELESPVFKVNTSYITAILQKFQPQKMSSIYPDIPEILESYERFAKLDHAKELLEDRICHGN